MDEYVGAVDQGTTSTRFILFDSRGRYVCSHQLDHATFRPHPGWEEQDPLEILDNVKRCIKVTMTEAGERHSVTPSQVKAIGITNQRETTVVWDRVTGNPLYPAIVWQDVRTQHTSDQLRATHDSEHIRRICGLPISTYFSGVKLRWLIDNDPNVKAAVDNGTALFGTVDTWLTWNLSKERVHVTDVTNAGRTMLMNLRKLQWDEELMSIIGVPRSMLPEIRSSSEVYGTMADTPLVSVPIAGIIGDQQSALVGQCCFEVGEAKNTYGTGCFLIVNTGTEPKFSHNSLLTTPGYQLGPNSPCIYSLEGSVAVAGSAITWLRDALGLINSPADTELLASSVADTGGVYFVPAFTGLYAPWWREDARGTIVGMTQYTTKAHIARATLESVSFMVDAVLQAASADMGAPIKEVKVDGGMTRNDLLMQIQANIMGTDVVRPQLTETTALGAAFVAGHATGVYKSTEAFKESWQLNKRFEPEVVGEDRTSRLRKWNMAVDRSLGWCPSNGKVSEPSDDRLIASVSRDLLAGIAIGALAVGLVSVALKRW